MSEHLRLELPSYTFLAQLAREDPEAYEALRRELIEDLVESAPEHLKPRLRGLQFRIDAIRRLSPSALASTRKVFALMWESFLRLDEEVSGLRDFHLAPPARCKESARIIEFRPRAAHPPH